MNDFVFDSDVPETSDDNLSIIGNSKEDKELIETYKRLNAPYYNDDWKSKYRELDYESGNDISMDDYFEIIDSWNDDDLLQKAIDGDVVLSVKAIIVYDKDDEEPQFLVLEDSGTDWWDLPGGHIKDGETSGDGLIREIKEETGLELTNAVEIFITELKLGDEEEKPVLVYFVEVEDSDNIELSSEHTGYEWITLDEIDDYNLGVFVDVIEEAFELYWDDDFDDEHPDW